MTVRPATGGLTDAQDVLDAGQALSEMIRVTRKGGRVVDFDFDWDTLIIDHPDKETTRTIVPPYSDPIRNGWIGRFRTGIDLAVDPETSTESKKK
ncbi:MAG: hypothetical protein ACJ75K_08300 [Actinomycetes bacterium]